MEHLPENLWPTDEDWFEALEEFKQSIENPIVETSITQLPRKDDVADIIHKVNQYWMTTNPTHGNYFWNRAVYHIGNMEAYRTTGEPTYLDSPRHGPNTTIGAGRRGMTQANGPTRTVKTMCSSATAKHASKCIPNYTVSLRMKSASHGPNKYSNTKWALLPTTTYTG